MAKKSKSSDRKKITNDSGSNSSAENNAQNAQANPTTNKFSAKMLTIISLVIIAAILYFKFPYMQKDVDVSNYLKDNSTDFTILEDKITALNDQFDIIELRVDKIEQLTKKLVDNNNSNINMDSLDMADDIDIKDPQIDVTEIEINIMNLQRNLKDIKNQSDRNRLLFAILDVRRSIFKATDNLKEKIDIAKRIAVNDEYIIGKLTKIGELRNLRSAKDLKTEFSKQISGLINLNRSDKTDPSLLDKAAISLNKLVTIRKIKGDSANSNSDAFDLSLLKIQTALERKNIDEALKDVKKLDPKYQDELGDWVTDLENINQAIQDIKAINEYLIG